MIVIFVYFILIFIALIYRPTLFSYHQCMCFISHNSCPDLALSVRLYNPWTYKPTHFCRNCSPDDNDFEEKNRDNYEDVKEEEDEE